MFSISVLAAIPCFSDVRPSDLYLPKGWVQTDAVGTVSIGDERFVVDANGNPVGDDFQKWFENKSPIAQKAILAVQLALENQIKLDNLAEFVYSIMQDGKFYVEYTDTDGNSHVARVNYWDAATGLGKKSSKAPVQSLKTGKVKADGVSIEKGQDGTVSIGGWKTEGGQGWTLSDWYAGTGDNLPGTIADVELVVRSGKSFGPSYVPIGDGCIWGAGSAHVDGCSIVTNSDDGAVYDRKLSLFGIARAENESVPKWNGTSLEWVRMTGDGKSIDVNSTERGKDVFALKGFDGVGNAHIPYKGISGNLEWREFPNVTTNRVVGDEMSITSDGSGEEEKVFRLVGFSQGMPDNLFPVTSGGALAWRPAEEVVGCTCSNAWARVKDFVGTDFTAEDWEGFPDSWEWIGGGLTVDGGVVALDGWDDGACEASLERMLTDEGDGDRGRHLLLSKFDDGTLHYVPIGGVIRSGFSTDEASVSTNGTVKGVAEIKGFGSAAVGTVPVKTGGGIEWQAASAWVKFKGTDGSEASGTNVVFDAEGGNVKVTVNEDGDGIVKIKLEACYK